MAVKTKERKVQLPMMSVRASFAPESYNKEKRTIDLVWSVGAKGLRSGWDGSYYEELSMDPKHVKMGRLQSGNTPFVDSHEHRYNGTRAVLGRVLSAKIEGGVGTATVQLVDPATLRNPDAADTITKVEGGILRNVSVGYNVYTYERQPMVEGEDIPTFLATDWEPTEISIVPVGFDEHAAVRDKPQQAVPCVIINRDAPQDERDEEVSEMTEQERLEQERKAKEAVAAAEKAAAEKAAKEARDAEKARGNEIRSLVSKHGLPAEMAERAINEDKSVADVKDMVLAELARKSEETTTRSGVSATGGAPSQLASRKQAMENALLHRASPDKVALTEAGRIFRGMTLMEMGKDILRAGGFNPEGLGKMEVASAMFEAGRAGGLMSTGDFPNVLANVANKSLRKGYDEAPRTFLGWAKEASLPDFKQVSRTQLGEAPVLEKVLEDGEIKRGSIGEGAEKYQLATYAKIVAITRQVIINDDLGAFTSLAQKFGFAAASLESDVVYAILTANAALADSIALFNAGHSNLGTAGVPSITTIGELRKLIRLQKGVDGKRVLNLIGKFGLFPAALEVVARQLIAQTTPAQASQVQSPITFEPVIEPRLDAASSTAYYMVADPNQVDTVEYGYLEGQRGVYTETRQGFDVDGMEVKARLDFAAKAIDFRGMAKNTG